MEDDYTKEEGVSDNGIEEEDDFVEDTEEDKKAASLQGWTSIEEFRGDPKDWKTAKQFIEDGKEIAGIQVKKARSLEEKLQTVTADMEKMAAANKELQKTMTMLNEYNKQSLESAKAKFDLKMAELAEQKEQAVKDGNIEEYRNIEAREKIAEQQKPPLQSESAYSAHQNEQTTGMDDIAANWLNENEWYNTDPEAVMFADACFKVMSSKMNGRRNFTREELDSITEQVKTKFPEKFENPYRSRSSATGSNGGAPASLVRNKKRTFANLPAEAKAQCESFVKQIPGFTKEQYVKNYDWE